MTEDHAYKLLNNVLNKGGPTFDKDAEHLLSRTHFVKALIKAIHKPQGKNILENLKKVLNQLSSKALLKLVKIYSVPTTYEKIKNVFYALKNIDPEPASYEKINDVFYAEVLHRLLTRSNADHEKNNLVLGLDIKTFTQIIFNTDFERTTPYRNIMVPTGITLKCASIDKDEITKILSNLSIDVLVSIFKNCAHWYSHKPKSEDWKTHEIHCINSLSAELLCQIMLLENANDNLDLLSEEYINQAKSQYLFMDALSINLLDAKELLDLPLENKELKTQIEQVEQIMECVRPLNATNARAASLYRMLRVENDERRTLIKNNILAEKQIPAISNGKTIFDKVAHLKNGQQWNHFCLEKMQYDFVDVAQRFCRAEKDKLQAMNNPKAINEKPLLRGTNTKSFTMFQASAEKDDSSMKQDKSQTFLENKKEQSLSFLEAELALRLS